MLCPLCSSSQSKELPARKRKFYRCLRCGFAWADPGTRLGQEECRARYGLHRNGRDNGGYAAYLSRIIDRSLEWASRSGLPERVMDWGSGPNPLCAELLAQRGFDVLTWDPLYADNPLPEAGSVDLVLCVEAAEHFTDPRGDFAPCAAMAKPAGWVMVHTHTAPMDDDAFLAWWYIQDPTHVSFYTREALRLLGEQASLELIALEDGRLSVFQKTGRSFP